MAFTQGATQSVTVTTVVTSDHFTPTAPTTPVVTISTDGGATFGAPTNSAAATLYGISLLLSIAETAHPFVQVRVTSANCDPVVATFYFEDAWLAAKAGTLPASAAPGANGGLPTVNASNQVLALDGSGNAIAPESGGNIAALIAALTPEAATVNDAAATTTVFMTTLASAVTDFYKGAAIVFTTGALAGQSGEILGYNGGTKTVTLQSALTSAPVNGVAFRIVNTAASRKWANVLAAAWGADSRVLLSTDAQTGSQLDGATDGTLCEIINTCLAELSNRTNNSSLADLLGIPDTAAHTLLTDIAAGNVANVTGKVLGGGVDTITGTGVRADLPDAPNDTALAAAAAKVWAKPTSEITTAGSIGKRILDLIFGMSSLPAWIRGGFRKSAMDATAKTELNAGGGTYDETTDSTEALSESVGGIGGGTGSFAITLYVHDNLGNAVAGIEVTIPTVGPRTSAASTGAVTANVNAGTYSVTKRDTAAYTGGANEDVVVNGSGVVTAPTGGILTVTAVALPVPSSGCYLLAETWRDENEIAIVGGTVVVTDISLPGRVDATNNVGRAVISRDVTSDSNGLWSMSIAQAVFTAQATVTITKTWTDHAGATATKTQRAKLAAPATGTTVYWDDLSVIEP